MYPPMRRNKQLLSEEEAREMLDSATSGVLALQGADRYPYAIPLIFAREADRLYFHSAGAGHALDCVAHNSRASFCVIAQDDVVQATFTTHFRSVIAFGRIRLLTEDAEKRHALMLLAEKYSPDYLTEADDEIERTWGRVLAWELAMERLTGKAAKEIVSARSGPTCPTL